jgi:hypothetical protein
MKRRSRQGRRSCTAERGRQSHEQPHSAIGEHGRASGSRRLRRAGVGGNDGRGTDPGAVVASQSLMKRLMVGFVLGLILAWPLSARAAWFLRAADLAKMDQLAQTMYVAGAMDALDSIAGTQDEASGGNADSYVTMVHGCLQQRIGSTRATLGEFTTWVKHQWQRQDTFGPEHIPLANWSGASVMLLRACEAH